MSTSFYVSPSGSDAAAGTEAAPFKTLAKAVDAVNAGDEIVLRAGTYAGNVTLREPNLTIRNYPGERPVVSCPLDDPNQVNVIRFHIGADGGRLSGLEIVGSQYYGVKLESDWGNSDDAATNITIEDCVIHHTGRDAIKITGNSDDVTIRRCEIYDTGARDNTNAEGIDVVNADRLLVQDCYIHDTATSGLYSKGGGIGTVIERNRIENAGTLGIVLGFYTDAEFFDAANTRQYENIDGIVRNNVIVGTHYAGIGLYAALRPQVYNNTVIDAARDGQAAVYVSGGTGDNPPSKDVSFYNNIVVGGGQNPLFEVRASGLEGSLSMGDNRYFVTGGGAANLVYNDQGIDGTLAQWKAATGTDAGSTEGDPLLDATQHLLPNSPCVDAGSPSAAAAGVLDDIDKDPRPAGNAYDVGADEAGNAAPDNTPPSVTGVASGSVTAARATVTWGTNEFSDTQVEYGLTAAYGSLTPLNASPVLSHTATLTGLAPATAYHYRVLSRDRAGNLASSPDFTFTTAAPDTTPPVISGVSTSGVAPTAATVVWTTSEEADSQVEFGTSISYGNATTLDSAIVLSHSVLLAGLLPSTTYHYRVKSHDGSGNLTTSADFSFSTPEAGALPAGALAFWDMNQAGGTTALDTTGNNNTATLQNGATFTTGQTGNGLSFDGVNDSARIPRTAALETASVTLAAWVFLPAGTQADWATIIKKTYKNDSQDPWGSYSLQLSPNGQANRLVFATGHASGSNDMFSPSALPTGRWVHVAGTFDRASGTKTIYVDGVAVASSVQAEDIKYDATATGDIYLGQDPGTGEAFKGKLDAVGVWGRALSAPEVSSLASAVSSSDTTPPTISGVAAGQVTAGAATITWATDEASDTQVEYGTTAAYGASTTPATGLVMSHTQTLSGLVPSTLYHYRVRSRDLAGNTVVSGDLTFTTAALPSVDTTGPSAVASATGVTTVSDTGHVFTVTFSDDVGVNVGTLDGNDILVTGPNGFSEMATLVGVDVNFNGSPRSATYRFDAPGGSWDTPDNGTYTIALQAGQVTDIAGNPAGAGAIGTFDVNVSRALTGSFGLVNNRRAKLIFLDADGSRITATLGGGGTGTAYLEDGRLSLELAGTTIHSVLGISAKGGDRRLAIGNVRVGGALRSLSAVSGDLFGNVTVGGALGSVSVGTLQGATLAAAGGIFGLTVRGGVSGAHILAGMTLGSDGRLGGDGVAADAVTAAPAMIRRITVLGSISSSVFAAGVAPGDTTYGNGNDTLSGGVSSGILVVTSRGAVDGGTVFESGRFGTVHFGKLRVTPAGDVRLKLLA